MDGEIRHGIGLKICVEKLKGRHLVHANLLTSYSTKRLDMRLIGFVN